MNRVEASRESNPGRGNTYKTPASNQAISPEADFAAGVRLVYNKQ